MPTLSIIIPTCGRATLAATLFSLQGLEPDDQVIVVADGWQPNARETFTAAEGRVGEWRYLEVGCDRSVFGNFQRDCGMAEATGDLLLFIDDDDVYSPGALTAVRRSAEAAPGKPLIFRARWGAGHHAGGAELWHTRRVVVGNVGTPMVALPRLRYGACWMDGNDRGIVSDFEFLSAAIAQAGDPVWCDDLIAVVRPA